MAEPAAKKRRLSPPPETTATLPEAAATPTEVSASENADRALTEGLAPNMTETSDENTPIAASSATNSSAAPADRAARFAALKARATDSARSNLAEAKAEAQRSAIDPTVLSNLSRRSAIAQHKLLKADTEADDGDGTFERKRAWDYTIEESEKWDERMARKKEARDNNVFQDYSREAGKIYERQTRELEKNGGKDREDYEQQKAKLIEEAARNGALEVIETKDGELIAIDKDGKFYADSDNTGFVESKPKKENVDRLVEEIRKAEEVRLKKRRARGQDQDEGDVTFINEKNKQFNMKLARFYDRYTKDIRDSFERGLDLAVEGLVFLLNPYLPIIAIVPQSTILLIGAGVIGLSTALTLQQRYPNCQIVIIAAELPTDPHPTADYASMWAGAHYRPIPRSTAQLHDEADLAFSTAKMMLKIAKENPEAGVAVVQGVEYLETPPSENANLRTGDLYAGPEDNFRVLEVSELPKGVRWGCEYDSYCVNVPVYCRWLMQRFQVAGGRIAQQRLAGAKDAFAFAERLGLKGVKCVVNCSGRNFDTDPKMRVIRGQTVLVKQQYDKTVTRQCGDGSWAFLIPRPNSGGTIVGGSKEVGDFATGPRVETRRGLLEAAVKHFPEFVKDIDDFVVVKDNVGRRPWREGGLRIEAEGLDAGRLIVHGYGAGGRGYEMSWGAAERIVGLVDNSVELRSSL